MTQHDRPATCDEDSLWEDLVVSILSVNQYPLEKTYAVISLLRQGGLLNPENLGRWKSEELIDRLRASGCDRGPFMTHLFAGRLSSLGLAVESTGVLLFRQILLSNDPQAISDLLLPIRGIGPKVLSNFLFLRGIKPNNTI